MQNSLGILLAWSHIYPTPPETISSDSLGNTLQQETFRDIFGILLELSLMGYEYAIRNLFSCALGTTCGD